MSLDNMGSKQRAWLCAGNGSFIDPAADRTTLWVSGRERPVLVLCPLDAEDRELTEKMYGWAVADLHEQCHGWLRLYSHVARLVDACAALVCAVALAALCVPAGLLLAVA